MKLHLLLGMFVLFTAVAGLVQASSIAYVEANVPSGTAGTVLDYDPVITAILSQPGTVNGLTYTRWSFAANDGTGSAFLYSAMPTGNSYIPTVGDAIGATGTWSPYHQIPELTTLTDIYKDYTDVVPAPLSETISAVNSSTVPQNIAGQMITLHNVTISGIAGNPSTFDGTNLQGTITDSTGSMTLYYWPTSYSVENANLYGMAIPTGPVDMMGFVSVYSTAAEFTPISITSVPEPCALVLLGAGFVVAAVMFSRRRVSK